MANNVNKKKSGKHVSSAELIKRYDLDTVVKKQPTGMYLFSRDKYRKLSDDGKKAAYTVMMRSVQGRMGKLRSIDENVPGVRSLRTTLDLLGEHYDRDITIENALPTWDEINDPSLAELIMKEYGRIGELRTFQMEGAKAWYEKAKLMIHDGEFLTFDEYLHRKLMSLEPEVATLVDVMMDLIQTDMTLPNEFKYEVLESGLLVTLLGDKKAETNKEYSDFSPRDLDDIIDEAYLIIMGEPRPQ